MQRLSLRLIAFDLRRKRRRGGRGGRGSSQNIFGPGLKLLEPGERVGHLASFGGTDLEGDNAIGRAASVSVPGGALPSSAVLSLRFPRGSAGVGAPAAAASDPAVVPALGGSAGGGLCMAAPSFKSKRSESRGDFEAAMASNRC